MVRYFVYDRNSLNFCGSIFCINKIIIDSESLRGGKYNRRKFSQQFLNFPYYIGVFFIYFFLLNLYQSYGTDLFLMLNLLPIDT